MDIIINNLIEYSINPNFTNIHGFIVNNIGCTMGYIIWLVVERYPSEKLWSESQLG